MINFIKAKLEINFWEGIASPQPIINNNLVNCWVKLKMMGISVYETESPPPVVFNEYVWVKVISINADACSGILKTKLAHAIAWKAGDLFLPESTVLFNTDQIHAIKKLNDR